jgi:uncharacterized protein DUF4154
MALLGLRQRRWKAWLTRGLAVLLLAGGSVDAPGQTAPAKEYQVKAVFLYNFAQFVEWPGAAFPDAQTPLVIGVLGEDPFGGYLEETVRGEKVNNRPLMIERYRRAEEIKICHILFISRSEADRLEKIFVALKERNILTVGDFDGFTKSGGMMRFVTEKNKTRLRINLEAAKAARLTISSKLLRPAEIITSGKD